MVVTRKLRPALSAEFLAQTLARMPGTGLVAAWCISFPVTRTIRRAVKFAYDAVAEQFGEEKARALLVENPRAAFEGLPLPHVPEVSRPDERPKRKCFLLF